MHASGPINANAILYVQLGAIQMLMDTVKSGKCEKNPFSVAKAFYLLSIDRRSKKT
jgi:hypothetical protein